MNTPQPIQPQAKVDLKLGIKSSLPDVKPTIALFILLWESTGRLQEIIYAHQSENALVLNDDIMRSLLDFTQNARQAARISEESFCSSLNSNQLLKSQLEAIIVAFELIWKLGKISFEDNRAASAERTGGIRYPKRIAFSANMDVIHYAVCVGNKEKLIQTLLAWLKFDILPDKQTEDSLVHILCVFAEDAIFRLEINGQGDLIFNQLGIYQAGLSLKENVNISGDKEAKGALRILKNYLKESLNPFLSPINANEVGISESLKNELLTYSSRVSTLAALNAKDTVTPELDENPVTHSGDSSITQDSEKDIENPNRIYFGAPGTGKSHQLQEDAKQFFAEDNIERVTFYPNYSYAQFVGTYKPVMENCQFDIKNKEIVSILCDKNKTAQEKYDELYERFCDDSNLTRLPTLLGIYCGNDASNVKTKKLDGTPAANSNIVEVNSGIALRKFIPMQLHPNQEITYKYVPGPFMRIYTRAKKRPNEKFLLIIEELNRANAAAVFGDLFQLLDRVEDGSSEYPVTTSEDLRQYLASEGITDNETISLPTNMYIWTTMNSADQGVFPMDTAFRRRWDCEYLGIDTNEGKISDKVFKVGNKRYLWNDFRKAINSKLLDFKVNEDKLLGPFYVKPECFNNPDVAADVIKDKVLMYLYEDAGRPFRNNGFFSGCGTNDGITYSAIRDAFDKKGGEIFGVNSLEKDSNPDEKDI